MIAVETVPDLISADRVAAAILVLGAGLYGLIQAKKTSAEKAPTNDIAEVESRLKLHVNAIEVNIANKLDATHKHAQILPVLQGQVALLKSSVEDLTSRASIVGEIHTNIARILERLKMEPGR